MKALLVILALVGDWEEAFDRADPQTREAKEAVDQLSGDITLLNLVNGLDLTKDQMIRIIALSREAVDLRDSTIRLNADRIREYESALRDLRDVLAAGGSISPELEQKVLSRESGLKEIKRVYFVTLNGIEGRLRAVLTKSQIVAVESFEPCLIPPQDPKEPGRAGRGSRETRDIEDHLYTIRALPADRWKPAATALFDLFLTFEETLLGPFPEDERAAEIDRLMELGAKLRALPEDEFERDKGNLALEVIKPIRDLQEKSQSVQNDFMRASGGLTKVGKHLLNPRIVPIFEAKMKPAAGSGKPDPADAGKEDRPTLESLGSEPRFDRVAAWLGLDGDQFEKAREAISSAQIELICALSAPRDDGRNILREFLGCLLRQQQQEAEALLGSIVPGTDKSYWQRIVEIKADAENELRICLSPEQFDRYLSSGLDIFKVKRPYGRRK